MEENNNETVEQTVEQPTQEKQAEQPVVDNDVEPLKVKMKQLSSDTMDDVVKIDLSKPIENEKPEQTEEVAESTADDTGVVRSDESAEPVQEQKEVQQEGQAQESPAVEEPLQMLDEKPKPETKVDLPPGVDKLMEFIAETGGTIEDYVKLNRDVNEMDNLTVLEEYYKDTKSHLDSEEIKFLLDEKFSYDEDVDDEKDIKRKKIALKEQVAEAKAHLDRQKSKYYEEIKANRSLNPEAQKAVDFFNRYTEESKANKERFEQVNSVFKQKTDQVFNNEFKGFDFKVGENNLSLNVKDKETVKVNQSDINNFVKKFLNEEGAMEDAKGYHKGLFTAMNPDVVASHFYEQGKADALKNSIASAKNVSMNPRQVNTEVEVGGMKFKVLDPDTKVDFKVKKRK